MKTSLFQRNYAMRHFLLSRLVLLPVLLCLGLTAPSLAATRDDSASEKLGLKLALQCYTFNYKTFFETVDRAAALGIKYLEIYPGQRIRSDSTNAIHIGMSDEACADVKKKATEAGMKLVALGVCGIPAKEEEARKTFEFAKKMGIEVLVNVFPLNEVHDKLCDEYHVRIALHNYPKSWLPEQILQTCKARGSLVGACADTGHWMRGGRVPVDALRQLQGHILHLHFKDLNEFDEKGHDVPWGTGKGNAKGIIEELQRQGYQGYVSIEYERGLADAERDLPLCIDFFDSTAAELLRVNGSR